MGWNWRLIYKEDRPALLHLLRGKTDTALLHGGHIEYRMTRIFLSGQTENRTVMKGVTMTAVENALPGRVTWYRLVPENADTRRSGQLMFRLTTPLWDGAVIRNGEDLSMYNLALVDLKTGSFKFVMNIHQALEHVILRALPREDLPLYVSFFRTPQFLAEYSERMKQQETTWKQSLK